jgi:hypothetical protein
MAPGRNEHVRGLQADGLQHTVHSLGPRAVLRILGGEVLDDAAPRARPDHAVTADERRQAQRVSVAYITQLFYSNRCPQSVMMIQVELEISFRNPL